MAHQWELSVRTKGKGLYLITRSINEAVKDDLPSAGILNVFVKHTSASLVIQENADGTAREDLQGFMEQLVPEGQRWHKHRHEGPDDTTAHIRSALTCSSLNIPVHEGKLALGTWQGVFLWEHRRRGHSRRLLLTAISA